jgi:enoyl-CoA hydratase
MKNEPRIVRFATIEVEYDGPVARVCLNRPDRRNAVSPTMVQEFQDALDLVEHDDAVRVVVVKGRGGTFCSGYDLKAHYSGEDGQEPEPKRAQSDDLVWCEQTAKGYVRLWDMNKPTIAQIEGYCLAGGVMLGLQCDLVYAATDALIGQPQARALGMSVEFGLWPLTVGLRQTKELLYTGDVVTGEEAARLGMVNRALPPDEIEAYVDWMADRIALTPAAMLQITKRAVNEVADAMGYREMVRAAVYADTLQHYLDSNHEFRAQVQAADSARAAVKERDKAYGGIISRDHAWQLHQEETAVRPG